MDASSLRGTEDARAEAGRPAILLSSDVGLRVYERLGFRIARPLRLYADA